MNYALDIPMLIVHATPLNLISLHSNSTITQVIAAGRVNTKSSIPDERTYLLAAILPLPSSNTDLGLHSLRHHRRQKLKFDERRNNTCIGIVERSCESSILNHASQTCHQLQNALILGLSLSTARSTR